YNKILGGIVGDIIGSTREWNNVKTEDFELLPKGSRFTDDTVMTLAVAVKINDLTDNMDVRRYKELSDWDVKRLRKYLKAYQELTKQQN
ncbi:MAG: hypothetical protein IJO90_08380, partial [Alistipes sp.]|nr:hypothetical protein [Alistipes sp.]